MSRSIVFFTILFLSLSLQAREVERASKYDINQTIDKYVEALKQAGVQVLRTDKTKNKITGNPEAQVVFANPMFGTRIGECKKGVRKDIPLTTRIWRDGSNRVLMQYELPDPQINGFGVIECGSEVDNMSKVLNSFASKATE